MDFREINYILAIARHQNITRAADSLFISQPTLSKFLISLENDLGLKLFRKVGHKYFLTYAGERYVAKASEILRLKQDLDGELSEIRKTNAGTLSIGFTPLRCTYMLPAALPIFREKYPNVKLNLTEAVSSELDNILAGGKLEVGFSLRPLQANPRMDYETIMTEQLYLCTKKGHPVSRFAIREAGEKYPRLDPSLLKDECLLRLTSAQRTGSILDNILQQLDFTFADTMEIRSIPAIRTLIASGYGISFLFESHLKQMAPGEDIDCYRFSKEPVTSDFVAIMRKGSYISEYAAEFIQIIRDLYA
ncbi:MAG: LysR family transcriptional regulator [Clostridiales bacterium]|nr:LysR family transcriptional regulator [Candidatus Blautia equi]